MLESIQLMKAVQLLNPPSPRRICQGPVPCEIRTGKFSGWCLSLGRRVAQSRGSSVDLPESLQRLYEIVP